MKKSRVVRILAYAPVPDAPKVTDDEEGIRFDVTYETGNPEKPEHTIRIIKREERGGDRQVMRVLGIPAPKGLVTLRFADDTTDQPSHIEL